MFDRVCSCYQVVKDEKEFSRASFLDAMLQFVLAYSKQSTEVV